jgi:phage terminase large subunit
VIDRGELVQVFSNPGGIGALFLQDHFIDKTPDLEQYPEYDPNEWAFIRAGVKDNPYLNPKYVRRLKALPPERQRQLLHGEWGVYANQFFAAFQKETHVFAIEAE